MHAPVFFGILLPKFGLGAIVKVQKTVPGRVRVNFAQNGGHEKATKKAQALFF